MKNSHEKAGLHYAAGFFKNLISELNDIRSVHALFPHFHII